MINIIQQIRKIIGDPKYADLEIIIYEKEIVFNIWERKVPISISKEKIYTENLKESKEEYIVKFDAELFQGNLYVNELDELSKIAKVIEDNLTEILKCLEMQRGEHYAIARMGN